MIDRVKIGKIYQSDTILIIYFMIYDIQLKLFYVTFQGNSEIWSRKTGGRLIQV